MFPRRRVSGLLLVIALTSLSQLTAGRVVLDLELAVAVRAGVMLVDSRTLESVSMAPYIQRWKAGTYVMPVNAIIDFTVLTAGARVQASKEGYSYYLVFRGLVLVLEHAVVAF